MNNLNDRVKDLESNQKELAKTQNDFARGIDKLTRTIQEYTEKSFRVQGSFKDEFHSFKVSVEKLIERDKFQNRRLEKLEKDNNHTKQLIWMIAGGVMVIQSIIQLMGQGL